MGEPTSRMGVPAGVLMGVAIGVRGVPAGIARGTTWIGGPVERGGRKEESEVNAFLADLVLKMKLSCGDITCLQVSG